MGSGLVVGMALVVIRRERSGRMMEEEYIFDEDVFEA